MEVTIHSYENRPPNLRYVEPTGPGDTPWFKLETADYAQVINLFFDKKNLQEFHSQLVEVAAKLETFLATCDLSPAELAPAEVSEQDDEVPW